MFRSVRGYPAGRDAIQRSADRAAFARDRLHVGGDRPRNLKKPPFWRVFLTCLATPCSEASRAILQAETPVNEAPIALLSPAIDCTQAATAREI
jgi:hypothetical protein